MKLKRLTSVFLHVQVIEVEESFCPGFEWRTTYIGSDLGLLGQWDRFFLVPALISLCGEEPI